MKEWFTNNLDWIQWVFSGIGVLGITLIYTFFTKSKNKTKIANSSVNNSSAQGSVQGTVNGNVTVYNLDSNNSPSPKLSNKQKYSSKLRKNYSDLSDKIKKSESNRKELTYYLDNLEDKKKKLTKTYNSEYKDIITWMSENRDSLIDRSYEEILKKFKSTKYESEIPTNKFEIKYYQLEMSNLIDTIKLTLLVGNTKSIDEPNYKLSFDKTIYRTALGYVSNRANRIDSISEKSKNEFKKYIKYALDRF